ncbi:glycosyltransferase [Nonomuraea sp. NPDC059194]|uniref:glycosyltransferase n=1 Tax=Nonomuraea sp. NPDC059194 TaxID=3346764 RepID=UPI0036ACA064
MRAALVFVTVGTDHHKFDRLMTWLENWNGSAELVVQHGSSRPVGGARCHDFLPHPEMLELFATADAVVCQGGPGSIMEARRAGRLPIVVPRLARYDEVVDDHQVSFSRRVAELGKIALAETEHELHTLLDHAVREPDAFTVPPGGGDVGPAIERFVRLVEQLVSPWRRRG